MNSSYPCDVVHKIHMILCFVNACSNPSDEKKYSRGNFLFLLPFSAWWWLGRKKRLDSINDEQHRYYTYNMKYLVLVVLRGADKNAAAAAAGYCD